MASDTRFVLCSEGSEDAAFAKVYLLASGGELTLVRERKSASPYFTAKAAKAQVRRLVGTDMENILWTIEPPLP